jgi:hypothetical protein
LRAGVASWNDPFSTLDFLLLHRNGSVSSMELEVEAFWLLVTAHGATASIGHLPQALQMI